MPVATNLVEIHPMRTAADAGAFRTLNERWISEYFRLEEKDRQTLGDPQNQIVAKGGHVFIAEADGAAAGCVALIAFPDGMFELSKMAVDPAVQGRGIGHRLLEYALSEAKRMGARSVFLGSSSKLGNAVRLYERSGFRHVPPEELPPMGYVRADVFMLHELQTEVAKQPAG